MKTKKHKTDLFGKFDPVLNAVLKSVTPEKKGTRLEKAAQQPNSPTRKRATKNLR
jgi:hypothetical protein